MVLQPAQPGAELAESGLDALAAAGLALGSAGSLSEALQLVAEGAARAVGADVAIARVADEIRGRLNAAAVAAGSAAVAAELVGSHLPLDDLPEYELAEPDRLPKGVRRIAARVHASSVVVLPVHVEGRVRGSLELMRAGDPSMMSTAARIVAVAASSSEWRRSSSSLRFSRSTSSKTSLERETQEFGSFCK